MKKLYAIAGLALVVIQLAGVGCGKSTKNGVTANPQAVQNNQVPQYFPQQQSYFANYTDYGRPVVFYLGAYDSSLQTSPGFFVGPGAVPYMPSCAYTSVAAPHFYFSVGLNANIGMNWNTRAYSRTHYVYRKFYREVGCGHCVSRSTCCSGTVTTCGTPCCVDPCENPCDGGSFPPPAARARYAAMPTCDTSGGNGGGGTDFPPPAARVQLTSDPQEVIVNGKHFRAIDPATAQRLAQ